MASSAPASSDPAMTRSAPALRAGADRPASARIGAEYPSPLVRFLATPAAFVATNWAAILLALTVVGLIPALTAATRTTTDLRCHADRAFRETLRSGVALLRRDWIVSLAVWALLAVAAGDALILSELASGGVRVFLAGLAVPPTWLVASFLSAYVVLAAGSDPAAGRREIAGRALVLMTRKPLQALLVPAVIVAVCPLWVLAPLTIAIGFSLTPFLVARFWGRVDALLV